MKRKLEQVCQNIQSHTNPWKVAGSNLMAVNVEDNLHRMLTLPGAVACNPPAIIPGSRWTSARFQLYIPVGLPASRQLDVHATAILLYLMEEGSSVMIKLHRCLGHRMSLSAVTSVNYVVLFVGVLE
jgi:hypothetical protein